jgi:hypothetical protein
MTAFKATTNRHSFPVGCQKYHLTLDFELLNKITAREGIKKCIYVTMVDVRKYYISYRKQRSEAYNNKYSQRMQENNSEQRYSFMI